MNSRAKNIFFPVTRIALILTFMVYCCIQSLSGAGVSYLILLLAAVYVSVMVIRESFPGATGVILSVAGAVITVPLLIIGGKSFIPLLFLTVLEVLSSFKAGLKWYLILIPCALIPGTEESAARIIICSITALFYIQNNLIIEPYKKQMFEDTLKEQGLKKDIERKEYEARAELQRNMLMAENRSLEERASLSQTLHDKLGHNINGSVYQLEAVKLLMRKDPDRSESMVQGVIDQLRTGMDEIRAILRKERPEKKRLAMLQLVDLCEDCRSKGVEAELKTEGDMSLLSDQQWEIILDNAYEAISNSMKYSRCRHINIKIIAMNKMVRCSISDDGIGCDSITDGMGIAGMRQRMRSAGGVLSFETTAGFTVNMLIPMQGE